MAAPKGNNNATKNKPWGDALSRALARHADGKDNALNLIADQVVNMAVNGDKWAIEEIGNRTDGRPAQSIDADIRHSGLAEILSGLGKTNNT